MSEYVPTAPAPVLEPAAAEFAAATANPPYLFDLGPVDGRKAVDDVQSGEIEKPAVDEEWVTVSGGPTGTVRVRIVKPAGSTGVLPVIADLAGYGKVTVPLLGMASPVFAPQMQATLPTQGTDVEVVVVPDTGHYFVEEQPQAVIDQFTEFFV